MARRPRRTPLTTLTAAATRIDLAKLSTPRTGTTTAETWQTEAWGYYDSVPEVMFAVNYVGNALAKLRLFAACYQPGAPADSDPIPVTDDRSGVPADIAQFAQAQVARIASLSGGQDEIQREFAQNWEVAGECFLVGWAARPLPGDGPNGPVHGAYWEIRSKEEIVVRDAMRRDGTSGATMFVQDSPNMKPDDQRPLVAGEDVAIRMWQRHPRWSGWPVSQLKACISELRTLNVLSGQLLAESMSRHNAGVMFVSNEVDIDAQPTTDPNTGDEVPPETFEVKMAKALVAPIHDPSDPSAVAPLVARVPGKPAEMVMHLDLSRESSDIDAKITARLVRLGHGLDLPPEVIEGHMSTTFANAEQINQDTFDDFLQPRASRQVQALTYAALQPDLAAEYPDSPEVTSRIFVWYDPSDLIGTADPAEAANDGWDRGLLSDNAWRSARGYSADDAPADLERLTRLAFRGTVTPTPEVIDAIFGLVGINVSPPVAPADAAPVSPPEPAVIAAAVAWLDGHPQHRRMLAEAGAIAQRGNPIEVRATLAAGRRHTPTGAQLVAIDRNLRERLIVLADQTMGQALATAGNRAANRMSSKMGNTLARQIKMTAACLRVARIGQALLADAGVAADELLDGAFEAMRPQFMAWGAGAQGDALDAVSRAVSGLSTAERSVIKARQAASLDEAWGWLERTLTSLAQARLFDPSPTAPALGEHDDTMRVPAGILRSAMAQAGGATGLHIDEHGGVWLPLSNGGSRPAGGIATGEEMSNTLTSNGATLDGYRWVYGPAHRTRPFDPHVELDGTEFANFDDAVLANGDSFPEFGFYMPGDHPGCICDFEPIVMDAPRT